MAQEGQTATNPTTGEKVIFRGGTWAPLGGSSSAPRIFQAPRNPIAAQKDDITIERGRQGMVLDAAGEARAQEKAARERREWEATHNPDGTPKAKMVGGLPELNESQAKNTGFYGAALSAEKEFGASGAATTPRGNLGTIGERMAPTIQNQIDDPARQRAQQAKENFIRASLRLESGAAIGDAEFARQNRIFFPQVGDSPEQIAQKARARQVVIDGFRIGAGPGSAAIEQKLSELYPDDRALVPTDVANKINEGGLSPKQQAAYDAFNKANPSATADQLRAFAGSIGWNLSNADDIVKARDRGGGVAPADTAIIKPPDISDARGEGGVTEGADAFVRGAADTISLGSADRIAAVGDTLFGEGSLDENLRRQRAIDTYDAQNSPWLRGAGQLAGGIVLPLGRGVTSARGLAALGGGTGAAYGYNSNEGWGTSAVKDAALGGIIGATVGGAAGVLGNRIRPRDGGPPDAGPLSRAGNEEGVDVNRAMVNPALQNRVTGVEATMAGGPVVQAALGKTRDQIQHGVLRLGNGGEAMTENVAGQTIADAGARLIKKSGDVVGKEYDRAVKLAGDTKIHAQEAIATVDDALARLSETGNTNAKEIAYLAGLKEDLSKPISVGALRDLRTTLRKQISQGELVFGQNEARVLGVMDSLANDINGGLVKAGKGEAATQFAKADGMYRQRMDFIKNTVQKLVGKRDSNFTPERVFSNMQAMATPKGDAQGLARTMRMLEPDEAADIAATFADGLGKNNKGEFSTAFLVSQAKKLPAAARENIFGEDGAKSLSNLIELAKAHSRVAGGLNNSRTGVANDYKSMIGNLIFGGGSGLYTGSALTGIAAGATGMAAKAGRDILSARALMSTDLSKWLASAPATSSPVVIARHVSKLSGIAAKNPAIAPEIESLANIITRAANDNVTAAAASGGEQQDQR